MAEVLLSIHKLVVRYGGVVAVDGVSFDLEEASIGGLIGPNGSGKSTLLAALSGARVANEGEIQFAGFSTRKMASWRLARIGLGRTFQGTRLIRGLTVRDNIQLGVEWSGSLRRKEVAARVSDAIEETGLDAVADDDPHDLPYGTQRLVELARAMVASPKLLLLDEPAAGMNPGERHDVEVVMRRLQERGVTQLLVEHDMDMIGRLCDRVHVLDTGQLIAEGTPEEVSKDPQVLEAYLGRK